MKNTQLLSTKFILLATLTVAAASSAACTAQQPLPEEKGVSKAKLLAPRPMMKATASPASRAALGVHEWRIYRGRNDVVLTGYDEDGEPVKGVSVGFHASDTDEATLRTRVLDGNMFAARHEYARGRTLMSAQIPAATSSFLRQALSDIAVLRKVVARTARDGAASPRNFGTSPQCGADMMAIVSSALQCVQNNGGSANANAIAQCVLAAQSAAGVGTACQATGTTPFDPTQGADPWGAGGMDPMGQAGSCGDPADPYGQGGAGMPCGGADPSDPYGQGGDPYGDPYGQGGDPYGQGGDPYGQGGNPYGDPYGQGGDPYGQGGMGDPYGQGGNPYEGWGENGMPNGDWCSDPFGDGAACPSCGGTGGENGGMGADIHANPMNGDVGYEGDFGGGGGGWDENF